MATLAIGLFFTPVVQGYYYSFSSVLNASTFFEAGVATAVIQFAAHETGNMVIRRREGVISGSPENVARFASIIRFAIRWYSVIAALMVLGVGIGGWLFFSARHDGVNWHAPWILLVVSAGADLALQPYFIILEGAGEISFAYAYRTVRAVVTSVLLPVLVISGFGLTAAGMSNFGGVLVGLMYAFVARNFLRRGLALEHKHSGLSWRKEILPFQWRVAMSWMAGYFTVSMFAPVVLAESGPVSAGRIGMSVTLFTACTSLAASFIQAHAPAMGGYAGASRWTELSELFKRKAVMSIGAAAALILAGLVGIAALDMLHIPLGSRLVSVPVMAVLGIGFLVYHIEGVLAFFSRAQKREPYYLLEFIGASIIFPSTLVLARSYGPAGVASGFAATHLLILLPFAYRIYRANHRAVLGDYPAVRRQRSPAQV